VAAEVDVEALGLLDGLESEARTERAELIAWLLDRGFSIDQIRASVAPLLLPANRVMGEDGVRLSARQVCEATGLDLELLQRLQGAVGLPRIEDPDAAVLSRVDGEAVAYAKVFLDMGVDPDETVAVMRVLIEGLHAGARCDVHVDGDLLRFFIGNDLVKTAARTNRAQVRNKRAFRTREQA
jgi:adenylate cyclase